MRGKTEITESTCYMTSVRRTAWHTPASHYEYGRGGYDDEVIRVFPPRR